MEYITLDIVENQYPKTLNPNLIPYNSVAKNTFDFTGIYPDINKVEFTINSINDIIPVEETTFQFILAIKKYKDDAPESIKYFTSPSFFTKLEDSLFEANPYFVNSSFGKYFYYDFSQKPTRQFTAQAQYIVEITLEETLSLFKQPTDLNKKSLKRLENETGVNFKKNIYYNYKDNSIDYEALVRYINWVVSSETLPEIIESNGVLTPDLLCEFDYGVLDSNGNFITKAQYDLETKMADLQDELIGVDSDIAKVEYAIQNPDKANLDLASLAIGAGASGLAAAGLGIAGSALAGAGALITTTTTLGLTGGIGTALGIAATTTTAATGLGTAVSILGALGGPIGIAAALVVGGLFAFFSSSKSKNEQQKKINEFVQNLKGELVKLKAKKAEIEVKLQNLKKDMTIVGSSEVNLSGANKIDLTK
jgi:hypothetical protein